MDNSLFTIDKLKTAWMKCRNFNFKDFRELYLFSERDLYDKNIDLILEDIRYKLHNGYEFHPKHIFPIPKKSGLNRRRVFINLQDQVVTHAILDIIGYKIDKQFYRHSYGNRLDRKQGKYGSSTFIYYVKQYNKFLKYITYHLNNGNAYYCETDITSFFDHIKHDKLFEQMERYKKDCSTDFIFDYLIRGFIKTPFIMNGRTLDNKDSGIPQGGAFSFFLSNVYLTQVDYEMSKIPNIKYSRYVDDIRIIGSSNIDVERALLTLQEYLFNLSLELNSSKTEISKVDQNINIQRFKEEQAEKLSHFNDLFIDKQDKQGINELKNLRDSNNDLLKEKNDFGELIKLRERKKIFATNKLIIKGVPESFTLLKETLETRLDKASFLLSYLNKYKHKVQGVEELNNTFLNRPYDLIYGVALRNKILWSNEFDLQMLNYSYKSGEVELALINNGEIKDNPLLFSLLVKKIYFNIHLANPFLVQTILHQFQKIHISNNLKDKFIYKLLEIEKYKELDISIYIADILKNDEFTLKEMEIRNNLIVDSYLNYLKIYSLNYYYKLVDYEEVNEKETILIQDGYVSLQKYVGNKMLSFREINRIMARVIQLITRSSYLEEPKYINFDNIWISEKDIFDFKIQLNPNPIKNEIFLTPEEVFYQKVNKELTSSMIVGLIWISIYLKNPTDLTNYYQPYMQFNALSFWKNNNKLFKEIYRKKTLEGTQDYHDFIANFKMINKLVKKTPELRLNIKKIKGVESSLSQNENIDVFYSYSHEDEVYRNQLEKHLTILKRNGIINGWSDRDIGAGEEWKASIDDKLENAKVILLLISSDFLASDYCYEIEMKRALERHDLGEAKVIPIILRSCDWSDAPFSKLQALPAEAKPINKWDDKDEAFMVVSKAIKKAIENIRI